MPSEYDLGYDDGVHDRTRRMDTPEYHAGYDAGREERWKNGTETPENETQISLPIIGETQEGKE